MSTKRSKVISHAAAENTSHNEEENSSMETDPRMTQVLE